MTSPQRIVFSVADKGGVIAMIMVIMGADLSAQRGDFKRRLSQVKLPDRFKAKTNHVFACALS
jgi:hypothetical protein